MQRQEFGDMGAWSVSCQTELLPVQEGEAKYKEIQQSGEKTNISNVVIRTEPGDFITCLPSLIFVPLKRDFRQCFNEKPNGFGELECSFFKVICWFEILHFGHCDLFVICNLEFALCML